MDDDTFAIRLADGRPLPLRPSELPVLTHSDEIHLVSGDPNNEDAGGHAWGVGRRDKTEFPQRWGTDLRPWVEKVMRHPDGVVLSDGGDRLGFTATVDDVRVVVRLRRDETGRWRFSTAFPVGGRGVVKNTRHGRVDVPLDDQRIDG
ncbi:MAG: hypothetical protein NTV28_04775 [Propionibacteriales bacterium]|nr:hypothetical protein [Propionibacteriales bacterium]